MTTETVTSATVNAGKAATAWLNAFLATSNDENRPALYRTLSVEYFPSGVQFVGCDGTMLFRTWVPTDDDGEAEQPAADEAPERSVVVMDPDKFAVAFMRTLLAASKDSAHQTLALTVENAPEGDDAPLGSAFAAEHLTLHAFGQQLHCRLYEADFPAWRALRYGVDPAEIVTGMTLATRLFAAVGKLKDVLGVDCTFRGEARAIEVAGTAGSAPFHGLLMPMRRTRETAAAESEPASPEND